MIRSLALVAVLIATPVLAQEVGSPSTEHPGELTVAPYQASNANAGATPFEGTAMLAAFHGREGIDRIVDGMFDRAVADPRTAGIFHATDMARVRRTVKEQLCYILNGGCDYTGRDMASAHKEIGAQGADMGALVEDLQAAMRAEGIAFADQNRLLAKLAPMRRDVVTR